LEAVLRALADRTRLRLLNLLGGQEVCVCFLVEVLNLSQPKVSRHLAYLRRAGLVAAKREGKWMHYGMVRAQDPSVARLLGELQAVFCTDKQMKQDRLKLSRTSCKPALPTHSRVSSRPADSRPRIAPLRA
jgi:ArsR family transcriptional regulator